MNPILERPISVVLVLGGLTLAGCASQQVQSAAEPPARPPARWEAVMLPEQTAQESGDLAGVWWDERRDAQLSLRSSEPFLATNQWPEADQPSLDNPRYISLPKRPETLLYFRPEWRPR
jgi:hypothetical protein